MSDEPQLNPIPNEHSLDQVWTNIRTTQNQVAGMEAKIDSLISAVNMITSRPSKETNWIGIGSLIVALIVVVGTYVNARFIPVESIMEKHDRSLMEELKSSADHRYKAGVRDGKLATIETVLMKFVDVTHTRLIELEEGQASTEATQNALIPWIEAVDNHGSRKHVISAPQALHRAEQEMGK